MKNKLLTWLANTDGVTGIEYGFIACGMGLGILAGATIFADQFNAMQETISAYMTSDVTNIG